MTDALTIINKSPEQAALLATIATPENRAFMARLNAARRGYICFRCEHIFGADEAVYRVRCTIDGAGHQASSGVRAVQHTADDRKRTMRALRPHRASQRPAARSPADLLLRSVRLATPHRRDCRAGPPETRRRARAVPAVSDLRRAFRGESRRCRLLLGRLPAKGVPQASVREG